MIVNHTEGELKFKKFEYSQNIATNLSHHSLYRSEPKFHGNL